MSIGFICTRVLFCFPREVEALLYFPRGMLHTEQNNISAWYELPMCICGAQRDSQLQQPSSPCLTL